MLNTKGYIKRDFGNIDLLARKLSENSEQSKQAMAMPEEISSYYFNSAIKTIEKYHPFRKKISCLYDIYLNQFYYYKNKGYHHVTCRTKALKKAHEHKLYDIELDLNGKWLSWIRGACYILLAGFTGCRDSEIKSFSLDSYVEKKYGDTVIPLLTGIDTKPNMGGVKRAVSWVTIPIALKAIELLWDAYQFSREIWKAKLSQETYHKDERKRNLDDLNSLFISMPFLGATQPRVGRQAISDSIRNYVKSLNYKTNLDHVKEFNLLNTTRKNELKIGDILVPHPHAFRRTFAVYFVRNKLGSLIDLKYQYKHMNAVMTSWYSNQAHIASFFDMMIDEDLLSEISDENYAHITDTLYYIYNDAETLAGPEGKRILNLRSKSRTTIYLSREEISAQVREGRMSIIEHPSGHCTNPRCDRVCDMTTCQYKIVTKEKAVNLIKVRERLINKFNAMVDAQVNQPNILSKLYYEIRSIEKVFDEHQMSHIKFSGEISASLL
ncbi:MAG TPA: site-specific integrase [Halomonas sp.]|nr:site-specific integrase [Halomonas sp.]HBS81646.1 site-specific integrase [Halomonas campaniensis]